MSNKLNSKLKNIVKDYDSYKYVRILDIKTNKPIEIIERLNMKYIYIYFYESPKYDVIIFFNKSNKVYRIMLRFDKTSNNFLIYNDTLDVKMNDYFNFENLKIYNENNYEQINMNDLNFFEFIKKIDI